MPPAETQHPASNQWGVAMPKPKDPYPTVEAIDARLAEVARIIASPNITTSYRAALRREADQLLDRRLWLAARELTPAG